MGFLDSMKSLLGGGGEQDETGYWIYVRCGRCGEVIKTRIDLHNDLSPREEGGYMVSKTLVGSQRCFERVEATLIFDENRRLIDREITHGDFIAAEEFEAAGSN
jgi:hypothetical protein